MSPNAESSQIESPASNRDLQRHTLDQIVKLSIESSAEEQRIEKAHLESLDQENAGYQKALSADQQRHQRRLTELATTVQARQGSIDTRYKSELETIENAHEILSKHIAAQKENNDTAVKKQLEQARWLAESVLEAIETQADADDRQGHQDHETRLAEVAGMEASARSAMLRYEMLAFAVDAAPSDAAQQRLTAEPGPLLAEQRELAANLLRQLHGLSLPRLMAGLLPYALILIAAAIFGLAGWMFPTDPGTKFWAAGAAAAVAIAAGVVISMYYRGQGQAQATAAYVPLMQAIALTRKAVHADLDHSSTLRDQHVKDARRKCAHEVDVARDTVKPFQRQSAEQHRATSAEADGQYKSGLAGLEQWKHQAATELENDRTKIQQHIDQRAAGALEKALTTHTAALQHIQSDYASECDALQSRWSEGLRAVTELLAAGSGIDPRLVDWNSPAWAEWKSPAQFSGQVRFGEMKVDLAQLTSQVPVRLKLPETFVIPAMLALPAHASLLVEADHAGRSISIDVAQLVMARLLTQMPAGRVRFTIFDPVGLGQSFAGFMHLADHDESLVGSRIWTESEHLEQRLTDLTEHMETVIQKYLRNEYETIDQYNAQAGELAEPIRFLVLADFPIGFEQDSLRRLSSIATTGPRCGVYTIILRDTRQPLPPGSRMEEVISRSVHLIYKDGAFTWEDEVFKRFPLRIDPTPDEKVLTRLMDLVGKAAKEAKRVEVPFQSIAPKPDEFWSMSSRSDLRVPIGKSGATRLQAMRLGVGVAQHALVAGKTGSGKSNLMHTIVTNLAMWYSPDEVEFYLVDFKKGVEFKAYASSELPHARAIAVESDREFGLSVLQRVDAELTRRGAMFREAGVQDLTAYRDGTGKTLPRTVLLIDEFQEFFSEDDKLSQEAAVLLDRLVRQGRAFGVHVVLGSQTIGGSSGLARSTLGQMAVRVALQCTEADSQLILGDNNSAARLLTRPGEAVYNDAGGLVEANSPFQIAWLPDEQRGQYLNRIREMAAASNVARPQPIVFEGNSAAAVRKNQRLAALVERPTYPPAASAILAYVGEPVAIKEPSAIPFRRQSGANVLLVGQQEDGAIAIFSTLVASIAAQQKPQEALFYLMDGSATDSPYFGLLERVAATLPHQTKVVGWREVPETINELATAMSQRQGDDAHTGPAIYLLLFGLQRYRLLRHQEDDFSLSHSEEAPAPKTDKQFAELLSEGPALGIHTIVWADTPITLERTLDRPSMRQFDHRILFQMSASDSSNLIDSPLANRLGTHRALLYSEEQGTFEKFRPYEVPDDAWLQYLAEHLKHRPT